MALKHYVPVSVAVFLLVIAAAHRLSFPVAPFALIVLFGETLLGFQVEDGRVWHFLEGLWKPVKPRH